MFLRTTIFSAAIITAVTSTAGCSSTPVSPSDGGGEDGGGVDVATAPITSQFALRNGMRSLWMDHVLWTRMFLIDAINNLPQAPQTTQRLLKNQVDIGNAIKPFYGDAAGDKLASLLHDHITGAAALVTAAKANDAAGVAKAKTDWYANSDQIVAFLAGANPNWPAAALKMHMDLHLDQTLAEATARLKTDWVADIAAYDAVVAHILEMADVLAAGISAQFPDKVSVDANMSTGSGDLHRAMRSLWEDHVAWTRIYLIDAIGAFGDTPQTTARLLKNQVDIGNAIKPFYGDVAGDKLAMLLHDHIIGAATLVAAARANDVPGFATAKTAWYANADQIAEFLASANPNWPAADLKLHMKQHLDETLTEATARLTSDWVGDIAAYDAINAHILVMADILSDGIVKQKPGI